MTWIIVAKIEVITAEEQWNWSIGIASKKEELSWTLKERLYLLENIITNIVRFMSITYVKLFLFSRARK